MTTRSSYDHLLTAKQVAEILGVSARKVLSLPLKRIRIGSRTIRFRLADVYRTLEVDPTRGGGGNDDSA